MTANYLFVFAQVHEEYRIPELQSIAELYGIAITFPEEDVTKLDVSRPFMVLGLESEEDSIKLARRCILVKCVCFSYVLVSSSDVCVSRKVCPRVLRSRKDV